jgi:hypothetical protein
LILYFQENKLKKVNYEVDPNSTTTAYQVVEKNRYLKCFLCLGDEQAKSKEDIFNE